MTRVKDQKSLQILYISKKICFPLGFCMVVSRVITKRLVDLTTLGLYNPAAVSHLQFSFSPFLDNIREFVNEKCQYFPAGPVLPLHLQTKLCLKWHILEHHLIALASLPNELTLFGRNNLVNHNQPKMKPFARVNTYLWPQELEVSVNISKI